MALCSSPVSHILRNFNTSIIDDLARKNYRNWSVCIKSYLLSQDLWEVIEASSEPEPEDSETDFKIWRKKNATALLAIQNSCESDILAQIREIISAKIAWDTLAKIYEPEPPLVNSGKQVMLEKSQSPAINPIDLDEVQQLQSPIISEGDSSDPASPSQQASAKQSDPASHSQQAAAKQGIRNNEYLQFQHLDKAIKKGDWDDVKNFIELNPDAIKTKITPSGNTALHVAFIVGHLNIAEKLVQLMSAEDLAIQNHSGSTALTEVAMAGITRIAECMIKKNKNLACIKSFELLPVEWASIKGHKDMTRYLYSVTPIDLLFPENGNQGAQLLISSIFSKIYDVALDLLMRCPRLTTARTGRGTIPLVRLASMPFAFPSGSRLTFWQRWIYSSIHNVALPTAFSEVRVYIPQNGQSEGDSIIQLPVLSQLRRLVSNFLKFIGIKEIYDMKCTHHHVLELLRCMCQEISTSNLNKNFKVAQRDAVFEATKHGIIEFIIEMSKVDPDVLYLQTSSGNIFMSAILHRQETIFSLIYGLGTRKHFFTSVVDNCDSYNNMLHIAGHLAPPSQLARISGAALQMQRELQWFKEVESILNPSDREYLNCKDETPRQVFTKNHKKLVKDGEKWMKETATSCTVVGALIITIMFAAAFTIPGGNDQNTGFPIFLHKKLFMVFIISDAISLFSSSTSVLMFLGILTSRYEEDDFLESLPTKLIIGLSTLFVSITSMMVAFSTALLIMLKGQLQIVIPIVSLASIPVTLFLWLQFPLLVEIFISTYGPSIFDRNMKPWL